VSLDTQLSVQFWSSYTFSWTHLASNSQSRLHFNWKRDGGLKRSLVLIQLQDQLHSFRSPYNFGQSIRIESTTDRKGASILNSNLQGVWRWGQGGSPSSWLRWPFVEGPNYETVVQRKWFWVPVPSTEKGRKPIILMDFPFSAAWSPSSDRTLNSVSRRNGHIHQVEPTLPQSSLYSKHLFCGWLESNQGSSGKGV